MHFSSLFLASLSAAATVKAAKGGNSIKFELGIIRADMELAVGAINGSVLANLPSEDKISCKDPACSSQTATFYLNKEALFLYSEGLNQEIYVDFSPQGQGKIGYTTGDQQPPNDSTPDGWQITVDNHLQFNNKDVIACHNGQGDTSSGEGSFTLFAPLDGIIENPKAPQGKDCGSGVIKIHKDESPILCTY